MRKGIDGTDGATPTRQSQHVESHRNKTQQKVILDIIIKGTKNKEIDIQLFSFVAKFIIDSERFTRN